MKKISCYMVMALPLLLFSCTATNDEPISGLALSHQKSLPEAANSSNPYDIAGSLRNEILTIYMQQKPGALPTSEVISLLDSIAGSLPSFSALKSSGYRVPNPNDIGGMVSDGSGYRETVFNRVGLSPAAKTSISSFIDILLSRQDEPFESLYPFMVDYESNVAANTALSGTDKKMLLTTVAVERYAAYYRKKPKDRDWDLLITNIMAGLDGTETDAASAIIFSATVEVVLHVE